MDAHADAHADACSGCIEWTGSRCSCNGGKVIASAPRKPNLISDLVSTQWIDAL
jgi:hypothetical protein